MATSPETHTLQGCIDAGFFTFLLPIAILEPPIETLFVLAGQIAAHMIRPDLFVDPNINTFHGTWLFLAEARNVMVSYLAAKAVSHLVVSRSIFSKPYP